MVAQIEYKPSCRLKTVSTAVDMFTNFRRPDVTNYNRFTSVQFVKTGHCLYCGTPFFSNNNKPKEHKFCSPACACKYFRGKVKEENLKIACKNINHKEFEEFYKEYKGFVIAEILKYDRRYYEDMLDRYNEYAIRLFYKIKKLEKLRQKEINRYCYLRKSIEYFFLHVRDSHKNEVFYDECNIKTQQKILGCYND